MSMVSADLILAENVVDVVMTDGVVVEVVLSTTVIDLVVPAAAVSIGHASGVTYVYEQDTPLMSWNIVHNLGKVPSITVLDSISRMVIGFDVEIVSINELTLTFSALISGSAYLN